MNKPLQSVIAINSFSIGILIPVLNLVLLEKGASLQSLPLLIAMYSLTVLLMELPSGIIADMYGRKTVFLISCGFQLISFTLLLAAGNTACLAFALAFFGLGRAFSSGSIDALFIDSALAEHGEECLSKATTRLAILDGTGLALGGIAGGLIAQATGTYTSNIVLRLMLTVILLFLCIVFVKETAAKDRNQQRISLIDLVRQGKQLIFSSNKLGLIFIGVFFIGFLLFTIEAYWQPAFLQIALFKNNTWVLGLITFMGFLAVIAGNAIAQKLLNNSNNWWSMYNICRIAIATIILVFALQKSVAGFLLGYAGIYFFLGAGNIAESSIINKYTPGNMRASVLSFSSLIAQTGGLAASLFSSIVVLRLQFWGIWVVAGTGLGIYAIVAAVIINRKKTENGQEDML